jgi:hypothetical protein
MAGTPEDTIRAAAQAYMEGDNNALEAAMSDQVRVIGSEQRDRFDGRDYALQRLGQELERRRSFNSVGGTLVDAALAADDVHESGDLAWWSGSGNLNVDGTYHNETTWTVILSRDEGDKAADWQIIHSHFSIHR